MSLYDDIRLKNRNNNIKKSNRLMINQKILNILFFTILSLIIVVDILYLVKENMVGIINISKGFMILSIILEILILIPLSIFKFNSENNLFKILILLIFSIPFVAYINMFSISMFSIVLFIFRLLLIMVFIAELVLNKKYYNTKSYILRYAIFSSIAIILLIVSISFLLNDESRRCKYKYDKDLNGYILNDIYDGTKDVKLKNNTVKISDDSLKNYNDKTLVLPKSVKEVEPNAFNDSGIKNVYINSNNITIYEALKNSNVKNVYLNNPDINILDIDLASINDEIRFIVSKDTINDYRNDNKDYSYLFIPKTDKDEYYVILNNTTSDILYFKKGDLFNLTDIKSPKNSNFILNGFKYTNNDKRIELNEFPIRIDRSIELTALWQYYIDYHTNGGTIDDEFIEFLDGEVVKPITPTRLGYDFLGWYSNPKFEGDEVLEVSEVGTSLYAKWELKKPILSISGDINKVYDGKTDSISVNLEHELLNEPGFSVSYSWLIINPDGSKEITLNLRDTLSLVNVENNTYVCQVTINHLGNNKTAISEEKKINISKANYDLTSLNLNNIEYEYNGNIQYPKINNINLIGDGLLNYEIIKDDSLLINANSSGTVTYKFNTSSTNYNNPKDINIVVSIKPKTLTINWDNLNFIYSDKKQNPKGELLGIIGDENCILNVFDINSINAGNYKTSLSLSGTDRNNYKLDSYEISYIIDKAINPYIPNTDNINKTFTYDGLAHTPVLDDLPRDVIISDSTIGLTNYTLSGSILYHFESLNPNYYAPNDFRLGGIIINKKNVNIEIINDNITYNGNIQYPIIKPIDILDDDISIESNVGYIDSNTYIINKSDLVISGSDKDNYNLEFVNLTFTIKKAEINVIWSNYEVEYNGEIQYAKAKAEVIDSDITFDLLVDKGYKDSNSYIVSIKEDPNYIAYENISHSFIINKASIEIEWQEEEFIYNNKEQKPICNPIGLKLNDSITFKYEFDNQPINAGLYNVSVKTDSINYNLVGNNLNYQFEIKKASLISDCEKYTIKEYNGTYDGMYHKPLVSGKYYNSINKEEIKYEILNEYIDYCVNKEVDIRFYSDDNNFDDYIVKSFVTIKHRIIEFEFDNLEFTYNEEIQNPNVINVINKIDTDNLDVICINNNVDAENNILFKYELIGNNKDNYIVTSNYYFNINKAKINISSNDYEINNETFEYDGMPHTVSVDILNNFEATYETLNSYSDVGSNYQIEVRFISTNNNYEIINTAFGRLTITKKIINVSIKNDNLVYNGNILRPELNDYKNELISNDDCEILIKNNSINAGSYNLELELDGINKSNYEISNEIITYQIKPLKVSVNWENSEFVFNNLVQLPKAYINTIDNKKVYVDVYAKEDTINAGYYTSYANVNETDSNYDILSNESFIFEIKKANLNIDYEFDNLNIIYDKLSHVPTVILNTNKAPDGSLITYELINNISAINYGSYEFNFKFMASNNYNSFNDKVTLNIKQREIEIIFKQLNFEYSDDLNITNDIISQTTALDGDTFDVSIGNLDEFKEKGTYIIEFNYDTNGNYYIKNTYTLIITGKLENIDVIINDVEVTYDGNCHYPTITNLPSWVDVSYGSNPINVCSETEVIITFTSNDPNRDVKNSIQKGYVTILKRELLVTLDETLTYNGKYQTPTYSLNNNIESDLITIRFNNTYKDSGNYSYNINDLTLSNNNYYISNDSNLSFEIIGCNVLLHWQDNLEFVYSNSIIKPNCYITYNDEIVDANISVTTNNESINVGTYIAYASVNDNNYIISNNTSVEFSIIQYEVTLNWSNLSFEYDGETHNPVCMVDALPKDYCNVLVTANDIIPGKYIAYATLQNSNYKISGNNYTQYEITKGKLSNLPTYRDVTTLIYNGEKQIPYILNDGFATDGSLIKYRCQGYTMCGEFNVSITFYTENNYYEEIVKEVSLTIEKRDISIEIIDKELKYNGEIRIPSFTYSNVCESDISTFDISIKSKDSHVGTHEIEFKLSDTTNYKIDKTYTFKIVKGDKDILSYINVTDTIKTYNGLYQLPTITGLDSIGVLVDETNSTGCKYITDTVATIRFMLAETETENYNVPESYNVNMEIKPKVVNVLWENTLFEYDGNYHVPTPYVDEADLCNDFVEAKYSDNSYLNNINRGTYSVSVDSLSNDNYILNSNSTTCEYEITYGNYDMSNVTFENSFATYNKKSNKVLSIDGILPNGVSVNYIYETDPIDVGSYNVVATFIGDESNYNKIPSMSAILEILPREISVTWSNIEFTYDKTSHVPTATINSGLIDGDTSNISVSGSKTDAGTYTATASTSNPNYVIKENNNSQEFVIKPITVTINSIYVDGKLGPNVEFNYDGISHNEIIVSFDETQILSNDICEVKYDNSQILSYYSDSAYPYTISFTNLNYIPSITSGTVKINMTYIWGKDSLELVQDNQSELPSIYATINGNRVLLSSLGTSSNPVYYKYYTDYNNTKEVTEITESGTYYIKAISNYDGLYLQTGSWMAFKFSYTVPIKNYTWLPKETLSNSAISVSTSTSYTTGTDASGNSKNGLKLNSSGYYDVTINQETKITLYILVRKTSSTSSLTSTINVSGSNDINEDYVVESLVPLEITLDAGTYRFAKMSGAEGVLYQVDFEIL